MPVFRYKAIQADGGSYEKTAEAPDRFSLYKLVRKEGETIISVEEVRKKRGGDALLLFSFGGVKDIDRIVLIRNLGAMISAGLSVSRSLSVAERQSKNTKLKNVLVTLSEDIRKGNSFSEALEKHPKVFPTLVVSMVRAGEESGRLAESLTAISEQLNRSYILRRKIRGALMYPAIIITTMIIIAIVMLIYVVPTLSETFASLGVELPKSTQAILGFSNFLVNNTLLVLILFFIITTLIALAARTAQGKRMFDFILLHIPLIGTLVKEANAARTTRTLSSLLSSGVEVVKALSITCDIVQNSYHKDVLREAQKVIQRGDSLSHVFVKHDRLYPILVGEMIAVGEETGKLAPMLMQVAEFYEGAVDQKTKDMSTVIEPFLMVVVGAAVGFFAISMISPIYSLSGSI